ncbi:MAG: glycosyl hydrolase 43 family protein [Alteromonadaceae bacterium]|nr:glycosyl hydrolase 43 family protein [Alteromonadaceae bacterium]
MVKKVLLVCILLLAFMSFSSQSADNPVIWADVPDVSTIRVGDTYYMSSTTMHMSPGLPIMKSKDLVNWEIAGYAYDRLVENGKMNLNNGQDAYGKGSWASSLRYHNGTFYAATFSATSGKTHVYSTTDIENGPWEAHSFAPVLHDNSLFFDDDGRVYMIYGGGEISLIELNADASGIKSGGIHKVIIDNVNMAFGEHEVGGLPGEGSQMHKINGKYYLFHIASPKSRWARSVIIHRADNIEGHYESRVALDFAQIAQGGLVDTPNGDWYAMLFGDRGAVGRIPYLVPVRWQDGWPVLGENGEVPSSLALPDNQNGIRGIVASDEFERRAGEPALPKVWQWNHNPDNAHWEIITNPGRLRLTTSRVDNTVLSAKNTLTQRTFGPRSSATTSVNVAHMKDGDVAGLIALQNKYGYVGVKAGSNGQKSVVMVRSSLGLDDEENKRGTVAVNQLSESYDTLASVPVTQEHVFLRVDTDFTSDTALFYYSLDGQQWHKIGEPLPMLYTFTKHFMGYRYGLFNYATKDAGGYVDFDYFRIGESVHALFAAVNH